MNLQENLSCWTNALRKISIGTFRTVLHHPRNWKVTDLRPTTKKNINLFYLRIASNRSTEQQQIIQVRFSFIMPVEPASIPLALLLSYFA